MRSVNKVEIAEVKNRPREAESSDGRQESHIALEAALDKKALEPVLLDVRDICSYTNYILVVSGRSDRQVEAIADGISRALREHGVHPLGIEGIGSGQWVLVDFGDLVAHVFHHPIREHYDIESLWIDAARIPIDVPDEARIGADEY